MIATIAVLCSFAVMLYRWYLLIVLWAWFIVPHFGASPLTYGQAAGASLFWSLFTYEHDEKDRSASQIAGLVASYAIGMTIFMGISWVVRHFV